MTSKREQNTISIFNIASTLYENALFLPKLKAEDIEWFCHNYVPSSNDVYIATYPKCGTTWVGDMCHEINKHYFGESNAFPAQYKFIRSESHSKLVEFLDKTQHSFRFWKVHAPAHLFPIKNNPFANNCNTSDSTRHKFKIIIVARNPKDACVSYYFHQKNINPNIIKTAYQGDFELFFNLYNSGLIRNTTYFDWYYNWYKIYLSKVNNSKVTTNDVKIHWIYYEDLNSNDVNVQKQEISKLIDFLILDLNDENKVKSNKMDLINHILKNTDFKVRQKDWNNRPNMVIKNFLRKGIVGDWKNHFNQTQSQIMDYLIKLKFYTMPQFKYYQAIENKQSFIIWSKL